MLFSLILTGSWSSVASTNAAMTTSFQQQHQQQHRRILQNPETGTIIHPLIPHKVHLQRRRLELQEKYGKDVSTALPPRPHTSRHSLSALLEEEQGQNGHDGIIDSPSSFVGDEQSRRYISTLRGNNNNNNNGGRHLQQQMGALYQGYGTHYIDLWVGTPTPQRQTVIVDTGSGVTAFPCEECTNCGATYHTDSYFKQSESATFRALNCDECFRGYCASMEGGKKCRISMSYAEGSSWSAYESYDLCYAGGPHDVPLQSGASGGDGPSNIDHINPIEASQFAFELAFGCQISITGLFITQLADGIMGMENDKTSFWKQMHDKNAIPRPEFSLCFSRQDEAERDGTGAGAMTLGGVDPRLHMTPMVFAKNTKSSGFYSVHVKAVYLREGGGISAQVSKEDMDKRMHRLNVAESQLNNGNVIVDSGTTDTYFTRALADPFKQAWQQIVGKSYSHAAVNLTPQEIAALPTIIIVISGADSNIGDEPEGDPNDIPGYAGDYLSPGSPTDVVLAIPASHYLEFDPDNGNYVPRFYVDENSGSVLGANAMMGHDVFFDTENERVGWAESDCDYDALLVSDGSFSVAPKKAKVDVSTKTELPSGDEDDDDDTDYDDDDDDDEDNADGGYTIFEPKQGDGTSSSYSDKAAIILEDMKHSCSSIECRGIAGLCILAALTVVTIMIRRTMSRRRVMRQYQEAELEISDLALDSDDDSQDGGRWVDDEPELPRIS